MATDKRERQRANREQKYQQQAKQVRRDTTKRRFLIGVAAVVGGLALVLVLAWIGGAFSDDEEAVDTIDSTLPAELTATTVPAEPAAFVYGTGECPPEGGAPEPVRTFSEAPSLCIDPEASYAATFTTSMGDIVVELDTANVPGTVNNFVTLANYGYYDDTLIFRADPSIDIVQGGGRTNSDSPGYTIPDERGGFSYEEGQLVMARTSEPNSAGGQWFFVGGPNAANLDAQGTYVVFGTVTEGIEIVQEIIASVDANGPPPEEVVVESVTITEGGSTTESAVEPGATEPTTAPTATG